MHAMVHVTPVALCTDKDRVCIQQTDESHNHQSSNAEHSSVFLQSWVGTPTFLPRLNWLNKCVAGDWHYIAL